MDKAELIEAIRELNSSATVEFLEQFPEYELQEYIDHLLALNMSQLTAATPAAPAY